MKYIALYEINLIINPVVETSPFLYCIIHWKGSFIQDYEFYYYYHLNLRILMLHIGNCMPSVQLDTCAETHF